MKILSVKQPWACLIIEGIKPIDNRNWRCPEKYIGQRIGIHASKMAEYDNCFSAFAPFFELNSKQFSSLSSDKKKEIIEYSKIRSAIIGTVEIVGYEINSDNIWADKTRGKIDLNKDILLCNRKDIIYNWILANPIKFDKPIPASGKLRFWDFDL